MRNCEALLTKETPIDWNICRVSTQLSASSHRWRLTPLEWNSTATSSGVNGQPEGTIDVLLCPSGPGAAMPLEKSRYWGYTSQWNVLDYPSVAFPVTRVMPEVDVFERDYEPRNEQDRYNLELCELFHYVSADLYAMLTIL